MNLDGVPAHARPEITARNAAAISTISAASAIPRSCGEVNVIMYTSLPRRIHSAANSLISTDRSLRIFAAHTGHDQIEPHV